MNLATKNGQQQPSMLHLANQSLAGGNVKSDAPKTSGKLLVLKPSWENGVLSSPKDVTPTNNASSRAATNQVAVAPPVSSAPMRTSNNPKVPPGDRKTVTMNPIAGFPIERKPSLSQTQSRNDFFNLLKKKTSTNSSTVQTESGPDNLCPSQEKLGEVIKDVVTAPAIPHGTENGVEVTVNGETHEKGLSDAEEKDTGLCETVLSEEEAAFLRSLGWEEENNDEDDVGLTQEEINAFFRQVTNSFLLFRVDVIWLPQTWFRTFILVLTSGFNFFGGLEFLILV